MEELQLHRQVEINIYKKKVKHLMYEHHSRITTLKSEAELAIKMREDEYRKRFTELLNEKRSLKMELKEAELAEEDLVRQHNLDHAKEITKLRQEFEANVNAIEQKYEKKMKVLKEDSEQRRTHEIHEIEERKNAHIDRLLKDHDIAFSEIKNYYNDITHNNLDLIKTLKEDVAELKKKEATNDKLLFEVSQENKRLSEPLAKALREVDELRKMLSTHNKDRQSFTHTKTRLHDEEKSRSNMEWEFEVQKQRLDKVEKERRELYNKFERAIFDIKQKTFLRSSVVEQKLEALGDQLEKKEAKLGEVLSASSLDPSTLQMVTMKLDEVLDSKNQLIKALHSDVSKVSKAHNDLIQVYEAKLSEFGVPVEELGFVPLLANSNIGSASFAAGA